MSSDIEKPRLFISGSARTVMKKRHIREEDLKEVIAWAENTGNKLYQQETEKYLARKRILHATFYAIYSPHAEGYLVHTAYSHRSEIAEG